MVGDTQACLPRGMSGSIDEMSTSRNTPNRPDASAERIDGCVNWPLVPLRISLFLFFGGLACLVLFLPLHMREVGLNESHSRIISTVAPLVSILGPLIVGPASDRLGKHKVLLTGCLLLGAACYCLLLAVPLTSENGHFQESILNKAPNVQLKCGAIGATIVQERCSAAQCPRWSDTRAWELTVKNCRFDCGDKEFTKKPEKLTTETPTVTGDRDPSEDYIEPKDRDVAKRSVPDFDDGLDDAVLAKKFEALPESPYICFNRSAALGGMLCNTMAVNEQLSFNITLPEVASTDVSCQYPLSNVKILSGNDTYSSIHCRSGCTVKCNVRSSLWDRIGDGHMVCPAPMPLTDPEVTFWSYLMARSVADIFPVAALPLADTLVVVLSSFHNSDVGRELSFGALGAAVLTPLMALLVHLEVSPWPETPSALPILVFALLSLLSALALSRVKLPSVWYSRRMELGERPSQRVSHPGEAGVLLFVLLLLGIFWAALETYLPWFLWDAKYQVWELGLTVTAGTILAMPLMWNSETLVEYCGYTNIFIVSFAFYIIRFTGFGFLQATWPALACEVFEVFTLCLMWATAVLYTRNLAAKHLTATSQAMIVLAHFCLGRFLGTLISSSVLSMATPWDFFKGCSVAAAVAGWLYFCIYYCCVRPGCGRKKKLASSQLPPEAATTNGSYTPLRTIYRNNDQQARF